MNLGRVLTPNKIATGVAVGLLALGIVRLAFDTPMRDPLEREQALSVSDCLPTTEVPTTAAITLRQVPPPTKVENGKKVESPENPKSAKELVVVSTAPLKLELPGPLPNENETVDLVGKPITLTKASGAFTLQLRSDAVLVRHAGATLLLRAPARFGPAEDTSYPITVDAGAKAVVNKDKQAIFPAGTKLGTVQIGSGQSLVPQQPLAASTWVSDTSPTLIPVRISGQPGLADVAIEANRSGLRVDSASVSLVACAFRQFTAEDGSLVNTGWVRAGVSQPAGQGGAGKVTLALPSLVLPVAKDWFAPLLIAVSTSDGRSVAFGGFNAIGRLYAAFGATALTMLLLGPLMYFRGQRLKEERDGSESPRWFAGLFTGPDNDPSLSLLQVFIWTVITVWGFFYVFLVAGNLLVLTVEMMGLLGIAGTGTVLARWIAASSGGSTSGLPAQSGAQAGAAGIPPATPARPQAHDFWKMLSTNGNFDLLKLQLFAFTVVIAMYVIWRVADAAAFPVLDANTLLLMGVSQGVYIAGKLAGTSALAKAQALKLELDLWTGTKKELEVQKKALDDAKLGLDKEVKELGEKPVPSELESKLKTQGEDLEKVSKQLEVTQTKIAELQLAYANVVADLGLTKT